MNRRGAFVLRSSLAAAVGLCGLGPRARAQEAPLAIEVVRKDADRRIDVLVAGAPFTSYLWPESVAKPVLFPLRSPAGTVITRGYPLAPRPDEPQDHPHHVGSWLSYGDVEGVNFWDNPGRLGKSSSDSFVRRAWKALRQLVSGPTLGRIVHRSIEEARGGAGQGALAVTAEWVEADGEVILREATRFVFSAAGDRRVIDRVTTLSAADGPVDLPDNKEGFLALRLAHALEHRGPQNPTGTGVYRSSEGKVGEAVWGTRARWVMLTGKVDGELVTVAVLDHPRNPGHPTYWHTRGYGLFAANPLGQKALSGGKETLSFRIAPASPARFAFRIVMLSGEASPGDIEKEYDRWKVEPR